MSERQRTFECQGAGAGAVHNLVGGNANGMQLLQPSTVERIFEEQVSGPDLVLIVSLHFGLGFGLPEPQTLPFLSNHKICFSGGWGGSMVICDLDRRTTIAYMTIAYMMDRMGAGTLGNERTAQYARLVFESLE